MSPAERAAILTAARPILSDSPIAGSVVSAIVEHDGALIDAAMAVEDGAWGEPWVRPLPEQRAEELGAWIALLGRRRGQLAHELSGPATGVLAALETVIEYEPIPASTRELLTEARAGMIRLSRLLGDRAFSLIEGENAIEAPLAPLLRRWAGDTAELLDPRGERIELSVDAPDRPERVDANLLSGALGVLIGNAWRSRRGQRVRIAIDVRLSESVLYLRASDDAGGMSPEIARRAGELGFTTRSNGVGMGLFLVRWAVRRRGGGVLITPNAAGTDITVFAARQPLRA